MEVTLSPNTLRLLYSLLVAQPLRVEASREEIEAVLTARDELVAAIAATEPPLEPDAIAG